MKELIKWRGKILDTLFISDPINNSLLEGKSSKGQSFKVISKLKTMFVVIVSAVWNFFFT